MARSTWIVLQDTEITPEGPLAEITVLVQQLGLDLYVARHRVNGSTTDSVYHDTRRDAMATAREMVAQYTA